MNERTTAEKKSHSHRPIKGLLSSAKEHPMTLPCGSQHSTLAIKRSRMHIIHSFNALKSAFISFGWNVCIMFFLLLASLRFWSRNCNFRIILIYKTTDLTREEETNCTDIGRSFRCFYYLWQAWSCGAESEAWTSNTHHCCASAAAASWIRQFLHSTTHCMHCKPGTKSRRKHYQSSHEQSMDSKQSWKSEN